MVPQPVYEAGAMEHGWARGAVRLGRLTQVARSKVARAGRHILATLAVGLTLPATAEIIPASIGVTAAGSPIRAGIHRDAMDPSGERVRVLLVAGLDGTVQSPALAAAILRNAEGHEFAVSAVRNAFPDRAPVEMFPPPGPAYGGEAVEAQYLWRFLGTLAPDVVVDLRLDDKPSSLVEALGRGATPAAVGRIPAVTLRLAASGRDGRELLSEAEERLRALAAGLPVSHARRELRLRLERSPEAVARQLAVVYGHSLESAVYIPALALIGRLRLGDLRGATPIADIERIARPYLDGKPSLGDRPTGSHLSGHLVFAELYERTGRDRWLELARAAADLGFDAAGEMRPSMPAHNEMSDSVFMGFAILARVGRLTGEDRYFRMALRHLRFMQALDLREDGIYRHSPLDEAAWGRGNGFPALGHALALTDWPADHPGREEVLASYRAHMAAMAGLQDPTGLWHQVVDRPESYREFTVTAMAAFAVMRGLRKGWLQRERFEPVADRAWDALKLRIGSDGTLVDVCRSTGKQTSLRAYFDREAILGRDDRGGAMALLAATERAYWERER